MRRQEGLPRTLPVPQPGQVISVPYLNPVGGPVDKHCAGAADCALPRSILSGNGWPGRCFASITTPGSAILGSTDPRTSRPVPQMTSSWRGNQSRVPTRLLDLDLFDTDSEPTVGILDDRVAVGEEENFRLQLPESLKRAKRLLLILTVFFGKRAQPLRLQVN